MNYGKKLTIQKKNLFQKKLNLENKKVITIFIHGKSYTNILKNITKKS